MKNAIKNVGYYAMAGLMGICVAVPTMLLLFAILRVCFDALTCPHNIFDRSASVSRWSVDR